MSAFVKMKAQAPPTINDKVFSINAWFINNSANPAADLSGYWKQLADAGIKHVRFGGIDANWIPLYSWGSGYVVDPSLNHVDKLIALIDSCRKYGMEPIIEVGFAPPGICSTSPLSGVSVSNAAKIAANVVDVINNQLYTASSGLKKKIEWWIISNEPDHKIECPSPTGSYGGFAWNNDTLGHADSIANYIRIFSAAMKGKDASIKIIGPEMASFSSWTGFSQSIMMKDMVTTSASSNLTGTQSGNFILDEVTFHHYPKLTNRSITIKNPTDITSGNALRAKLTANTSGDKGLVTLITNGGSGRTPANLKVGVTEFNIANTDTTINETTNYAGMIQGTGFRSFIGGQWLSLTLAEAMSNPSSGHYCLWSVKENGIINGNPCEDGFGFISNCTGNKKRPTYHHMAMTSHLRGSFYYGTATTNPTQVKTFAGVETTAGFHIMVLNMDSTTTYNTIQLRWDGTPASTGNLNINFNFASTLNAPVTNFYLDNTPLPAKSTALYEFDCHGTFIRRVDYTEAMAIADQAPQLRKIGGVAVNPSVFVTGANTLSGTVNSNKIYSSDTVYVTGNVNVMAGSKLTFLNSLVVVSPGMKININPNASLEIKSSILIGSNNDTWKGITANSNYHPGVGLLIDKSFILNADNAVSTDKLSQIQISESVIASANGQVAVSNSRGQKLNVENNLITGYQKGITTDRTPPNFTQKVSNNTFLDVKEIWSMVDDKFTNLEYTCNIMKGFQKGLVSDPATSVNDIGSSTLSAGNIFLQTGVQQDYIKLASPTTNYFYEGSRIAQFSIPGITSIPIIQAGTERVCAQKFVSDCLPLFNPIGVEENGYTNHEISIYPNPSSGMFNIQASGLKGIYTLNIHDVLGKLISTQKINMDTDNVVTFEIISKGLYFVSLESKGNRITKKVIVE